MNNKSKLIWITGLSGAGKTTIAKKVFQIIQQQNSNLVVHLDGDDMRDMLGELASFSSEGRKKTAEAYARICKYFTNRGISVIISTISMYHDIHKYNRKNNNNYYEILLDVDYNILESRNKKELYSSGARNVMGIDQVPEYPKNPDLVLKNDLDVQLSENVKKILQLLGYQWKNFISQSHNINICYLILSVIKKSNHYEVLFVN